jgi:hypothetical protein
VILNTLNFSFLQPNHQYCRPPQSRETIPLTFTLTITITIFITITLGSPFCPFRQGHETNCLQREKKKTFRVVYSVLQYIHAYLGQGEGEQAAATQVAAGGGCQAVTAVLAALAAAGRAEAAQRNHEAVAAQTNHLWLLYSL